MHEPPPLPPFSQPSSQPSSQVSASSPPWVPASGEPPPPFRAVDGRDTRPTPSGSALIPTGNPMALVAYYLGIFSLIPVFGVLPAIPAIFLGIGGIRRVDQYPEVKGRVHAWIGVIGGSLGLLCGIAAVALIFLRPR